VEWIQIWTMIGAMAGIVGLQSFWMGRALDDIRGRIDRIELRLDRIELRLDRIETSVLRDHGERIARLEERVSE